MSHSLATTADGTTADHAGHHDPAASRIGMWLFLFTEILLFGTLFIAFAVYLRKYHFDFREASHELSRMTGAVNTGILLTSSMTMALAIAAMERARRSLAQGMLLCTVLFAAAFLVIKAYEWSGKFAHDIYPKSANMLLRPVGEQVFYGLYFTMTGLHALHVVIGAVVIVWAMILVQMNRVHSGRITFLDNTGLYWHLVDLIWIFLFPLFYLIR